LLKAQNGGLHLVKSRWYIGRNWECNTFLLMMKVISKKILTQVF